MLCRSRIFPGDCRAARNSVHVSFRFLRKLFPLVQPVLDALRPRIIGGGSEAKIAELLEQLAQQSGRCRYRLQGIEWVVHAHAGGGLRHELRNAESAGWAYGAGLEAAFLKQQANEERRGQTIFLCRIRHRLADILRCSMNHRPWRWPTKRQRWGLRKL